MWETKTEKAWYESIICMCRTGIKSCFGWSTYSTSLPHNILTCILSILFYCSVAFYIVFRCKLFQFKHTSTKTVNTTLHYSPNLLRVCHAMVLACSINEAGEYIVHMLREEENNSSIWCLSILHSAYEWTLSGKKQKTCGTETSWA